MWARLHSSIAALVDADPELSMHDLGWSRDDLGVPRYLRAQLPQARVLTVGIVERATDAQGDRSPGSRDGAFDLQVETPRHPRADPCEAFRKRPAASG